MSFKEILDNADGDLYYYDRASGTNKRARCTNHLCSKSYRCEWYIHSTDAYKVAKISHKNEAKCEIFEERE